MALARFALKKLQHRVIPSSSSAASWYLLSSHVSNGTVDRQDSYETNGQKAIRWFSTSPTSDDKNLVRDDEPSEKGREISVDEGRKKSKLFPMSLRKGGGLWSSNRDVAPFDLQYLFPSGLGQALLQASDNFNRLFGNLSRHMGRVKERDDCYKIKYQVPGLAKEDIKVTVEDGVLTITGEHKEEDASDDEDDDEHYWSSASYYNTSLVLPDDAKVDEVKAEMKDGVLCIIVPKTERPKKDVKEVPIH